MNRRSLLLVVCVGLLAGIPPGYGQKPAKVWRIGFLANGPRPADGSLPKAFRQSLERLGYVEGKNVAFIGRWAEANSERLPALATELATLGIDVLLTTGAPAAESAKKATSTIPIVFVAPGDAASTGLVSSLSRPGGNITGISDPATELSAKRLGLLKEAVPSATRIAVLWNANDRAMTLRYEEVEKAARTLHLAVEPIGLSESRDIDAALS